MSKRQTFPQLLEAYLVRAKLAQRDFAASVGISGGFPANMIAGKRTPPLAKVPLMAKALHLNEEESDAFTTAAYLAHAPDQLRLLVEKYENEAEKADRIIADLTARVEHLEQAARVRRGSR